MNSIVTSLVAFIGAMTLVSSINDLKILRVSLSFTLGTTKGLDRASDSMVPRNVLIHQAGENS